MSESSPALWQQLLASARVLAAVRAGRSTATEFEGLQPQLRAGVQALSLQVLRSLGLAQALRQQLAQRPPPPAADALLCTSLALLAADLPAYPPHTLVSQAVEAAKRDAATLHQASFINGCLRRFLREREALLARVKQRPEALYNHPQWWIERLRKDHPEHWQTILAAGQRPAPIVLRVNQRLISRTNYQSELESVGLAAQAVGPYGLQLARSLPVQNLPGYAQGWFSVQDAAAQLAAPLLLGGLQAAGQRLRVLDACAAPGGKTAHLLEWADADVLALELDALRARRIEVNLARLQLQARVQVADAAQPEAWWDQQPFDAILLDAPCTASGIVGRHPDVRWLRRPQDIGALAEQQSRLLQALWPLVRPGGRLLLCTCSVFRAEGQDQVQAFLARHKDAHLLPSPGHLLPGAGLSGPAIPDNLGREHDGFFYALLQRQAA
ncbi:MAG: 16S rRNA (cytosine(967)-C(5))-methyltransferase RsmB [Betaproteobacteria bacterium]